MATQAQPPVDLAAQNWAQRIDSLAQAGVKKKVIKQRVVPVMQEDLRQVAHGSQAMPNDAAVLSTQAAIQGKPVLQKQEKSSWSPDDLVGDITSDIGDLTWRAVPALAKFTWNLPTHLENTATVMSKGWSAKDNAWLKAHGYEHNDNPAEHLFDPSSWARQLRNISKTPILGLIPGVHTAAGLTTDPGREQLYHHPVSTALDVLPVASAAGKAAGIAGFAEGAEAGSARAAFAEGHPVKALYRGIVPEGTREAIAAKGLEALRKVKLDPESFKFSRGFDIEGRRARAEFAGKLNEMGDGIIADVAKLPDEERALLTNEAAYPDQHPEPSPAHAELLSRIRDFNDQLVEDNPRLTTVERTSTVKKEVPYDTVEGIWHQADGTEVPVRSLEKGTKVANGKEMIEVALPDGTTQTVPHGEVTPADPQKILRVEPHPEYIDPDEQALLQSHRATREPEFGIRGEDRRTADRRVAEGEAPGGVERRQAQTFEEANAIDRAHGDRRVLDRRETPAQSLARRIREQSDIEAWRAEQGVTPERAARAAEYEAAGSKEMAAMLRGETAPMEAIQPELVAGYEEIQKMRADGRMPVDAPLTDVEQAYKAAVDERLAAETKGTSREKMADETTTQTQKYIYPTDSEVASAQRSMHAAENKAAEVADEAGQKVREQTIKETQRRMKEVDRRSGTLERAKKRLESAQAEVARAQNSAEVGRGRTATLEKALARHEKALANLEKRTNELNAAREALNNPRNRSIESAERRVAKAQEAITERRAKFDKAFAKNPPANMGPMMEERINARVAEAVRTQDPVMATTAGVDSMSSVDKYGVLSPEDYQQIRNEVLSTWQDVADKGYNPVWSHNVDVEQAGKVPSVRPLPDRNARVSQVKEAVYDLTPKVEDIAVSMSHAVKEYVREAATKRFLNDYLVPRTKSWGDIRDFVHQEAELMRAKGKVPRGVSEDGALQLALNKHFVEWNPDMIFTSQRPTLTGTATVGETKMYLPKHIAEVADEIIKPPTTQGLVKAAGTTTKVYKTSIMAFSLKHMAHVLFGGTVFMALRGGLEEITNIPEAVRMVREERMPLEIGRHIDVDSPDQMFQVAAGNKMGKLYMDSLGRGAKAKWKFDEFVVNVQRADAFLAEQSRALKRGATAEEAVEAGAQHVYKTLVDIEGMNPMERNVIRQVMPFYAFMRHTLRYILTYPVDHPLRAAMLSRISDIEQKDWDSGLPQSMQTLFFMGSPDKNGNITGVEMRQFNPFRDTGSYFTLAGFLQAIHPAAQIPLSIAGLDKFTGSPELYPELAYDPKTGNLVAKRPRNALWNSATTLVPELGIVDYFGGITQDMRELKARDPEAYKRRLYSMLFIPFEPKTVNKPLEAADMQSNLLRIAQQDVSNALGTGKTSSLSQYPVVPYQGELVPPQNLTNVIDYIKRIRPDVAPRSALPPVKLSKL